MMRKTTIDLLKEISRAIKIKARKTGVSQSEFIRSALANAVKDSKREMPRSFGSGKDGKVGARNFEDWLEETWERDW